MAELMDLNNEVIIADDKHLSIYAWSVIIRLQPRYYEKYRCIKIKVINSLLGKAESLLQFLKNVGIEEVERKKKNLVKGDGYVYSDAYEITLKKISSIDYFETEQDKNFWKKFLRKGKNKNMIKELIEEQEKSLKNLGK